jgi:beta-glucosidase
MSSYQTEGNNYNTDWWYAEENKKLSHKSGIANDFWNRYKEDIDLASELGCEVLRTSVEWSRIEPSEGNFDEEAIFHYKRIFEYARSKKLKIFLTLHHFTIPLWFENKGGFLNFNSPIYFSKYSLKCIQEFKQYVDFFATINEPGVLAISGYLYGEWPPFKKNQFQFSLALFNMHRCHNKSYKLIKSRYNSKIGIVTNLICYQPKTNSLWDRFFTFLYQDIKIWGNLDLVKNNTDFIGLNFYQTKIISGTNVTSNPEPQDDMGWYLNFDSLKILLKRLKKFNLPIYITENGLADSSDSLREWYLKYILISLSESIYQDKVPVKGYIYWSLIDNYEWQYGYSKEFGLVKVNRKENLKRIKRKSFAYYQNICKTKKIIE